MRGPAVHGLGSHRVARSANLRADALSDRPVAPPHNVIIAARTRCRRDPGDRICEDKSTIRMSTVEALWYRAARPNVKS